MLAVVCGLSFTARLILDPAWACSAVRSDWSGCASLLLNHYACQPAVQSGAHLWDGGASVVNLYAAGTGLRGMCWECFGGRCCPCALVEGWVESRSSTTTLAAEWGLISAVVMWPAVLSVPVSSPRLFLSPRSYPSCLSKK